MITFSRIGAVLSVLVVLTACSNAPVHSDVASKPSSTVTPLTCRQQYEAWKHGDAARALRPFNKAASAVKAAGTLDDIPKLRAALILAGKAAAKLAAFPVPHCADPVGHYASLLAHLQASAYNAKSASGLGGLILAEVPLKAVPKIERELTAELNRTVGKHR